MGAVAFTTTTGKVISGNRAYLRELNAKSPATATAIQKPKVSQGYEIAHLEILNRSRSSFWRFSFTIFRILPTGDNFTTTCLFLILAK